MDNILPHINEGEKILDIGAGPGYIGEALNKKGKVTLLDIVDYNQTSLPLITYNGRKIPFYDNSFDVGTIVAVLYHTPNPKKFLKEAMRVCRRLVIIEEVYLTKLGKIHLILWDKLWNMTSGISTHYNFNTDKKWRSIFNDLKLRILANKDFRSGLKNLHMKLYVLKK